jgi:hypothetical protein
MSDEVFEGKSLANLLAEIHYNTGEKRDTILAIIATLRQKLDSVDNIVVIAPIIRDYLDVLVKSDEHLIKIAAIVQRLIAMEKGNGPASIDDLFTEDEKERLRAEAKQEINSELDAIEKKVIAAVPTVESK